MMRQRRMAGIALAGAALVISAAAVAAPDLAVDPALRERSPALGFDSPTPDSAAPPSGPAPSLTAPAVAPAPAFPPAPVPAQAPDTSRTPPVVRAGNPLWSIPLSALTVTRERPLFSSSRRPPAPSVAVAPVTQVRSPPPAPAPREPERPRLSLVGTVGGEQGIAVFVDQSTQAIVRLRTGEGHDGWVLRAVGGGEVTLQNDRETAVLRLAREG
jgi:hypothetical protein